jgi:YfiR/HmsC-like
MINLINIENKMGFEINLDAAEHASLKISSKLLKLGKIIKEKN